MLRSVHKNQNAGVDIGQSIRTIQESGMEVMGGFILGFDQDTERTFEIQIQFIQDNAIPQAMVGLLTALPNTELQRRLQQEGRLLSLSTGDNFGLRTNFVTRMPEAQLAAGYKKVLRAIYEPGNYYRRCSDLIARMPAANLLENRRADTLRWKQLKGTAKVLRSQLPMIGGILAGLLASRDRFHHLAFLGKVLCTKPSRFDLALQLALRGKHYLEFSTELCRQEL